MMRFLGTSFLSSPIVLVLISTISVLRACPWCEQDPDKQRPLPAIHLLAHEARTTSNRSAVLTKAGPGIAWKKGTDSATPPALPSYWRPNGQLVRLHASRFSTEYLEKFFPNAETIGSFLLPTMCPEAARDALCALVLLIHDRPWRYFVNEQNDLVYALIHVEIFHAQLSLLVGLLERAGVDNQTGLVTTAQPSEPLPSVPLLEVWQTRPTSEIDFFAFYFDTIVRLTYLGVYFQDYVQTYTFYTHQAKALLLLRNSRYEQLYAQTHRLYGELLKMLQSRLWGGL